MRVFVYFNLHRRCWSIKALDGEHKGKVIAHAMGAELHGCTFKVSEAGRQRVLREQRKNVHAGVVGYLDALSSWVPVKGRLSTSDVRTNPTPIRRYEQAWHGVSYNPYKARLFFLRSTPGVAVRHADMVELTSEREVYACAPTMQAMPA